VISGKKKLPKTTS